MLFRVSFAVELIALLMAVGLGLYLVTRSVHRPEAWLAALTTWSMGGLFLNMLFSMAPPPVPNWMGALLIFWPKGILQQYPEAWLQGWTATLAPVFWFHGTMLMCPKPIKTWQKITLVCGYVIGSIIVLIQILMPGQYNTIAGDPLFLNALNAGPVYGLSLGILVLVCGLIIRNLILAARAEPRYLPHRQLVVLSVATILAGLTGPVGLMAAFLKIPVPMFLIALLIGAGVLVTSVGVARYSALMENRVFLQDFIQTVFVISAVTAFYLGITWGMSWLLSFPLFIYVPVGILVVISHSLLDAARQNVDFAFFQREKRLLRERLHSQESQIAKNRENSLGRLLESICEPIQAGYAVLLVRQNEHYQQAAAYRWAGFGLTLPASMLTADDLKHLLPRQLPEPLANAALLIPVYLGDQQTGALVLGEAEHGLDYSPVELDGLQEFSDALGGWLGYSARPDNGTPGSPEQKLPLDAWTFHKLPDEISSRAVELGLRNLHDYARLAELPLSETSFVRQHNHAGDISAHIETGKAVHELLCQALECLRPPGLETENRINGVPRREWYPYIILRDAYMNRLPNREIMDRLYISEGTFNRTRRSAIRSLTRQLVEMETRSLQESLVECNQARAMEDFS